MVQVLKIPPTSGICDWYATPLSKFLHQFFIDAFLETLIVCSVDQELGAVWL
jgi:hypothetical protein